MARFDRRLFLRDIKRLLVPAGIIVLYGMVTMGIWGECCPMVLLTGLPCPGCGLTRAAGLLLLGHFRGAWEMNGMVYFWIPFILWLLGERYLYRKPRTDDETGFRQEDGHHGGQRAAGERLANVYMILICTATIAYYLYRMLRYFPADEPLNYWEGNLCRAVWMLIK